VVVATQGRRDLQGLKAALALQPQGLWFVSSAKKASVLRSSLVASGEDADAVARIVAPAGEFIGAQTPEEIALSVLSSVVAARRARQAKWPAQVQPEPVQAFSDSAAMPEAAQDELVVAGGSAVATAVKSSCCGG
jgi:xanthine dehydrogenase accessory factor